MDKQSDRRRNSQPLCIQNQASSRSKLQSIDTMISKESSRSTTSLLKTNVRLQKRQSQLSNKRQAYLNNDMADVLDNDDVKQDDIKNNTGRLSVL